MLRSPATLSKPRASLPVSRVSPPNRTGAASRPTATSTRPHSATPATSYSHSRLPTPTPQSSQLALRNSRRRSSTLADERTTRPQPTAAPLPRLARRKSSDATSGDIPFAYKRRGMLRTSETPTYDRARSRTSPARSVYAANAYPTPPSSICPSASKRTTYQSVGVLPAANHIMRMLSPVKAPDAHIERQHTLYLPETTSSCRAFPSTTLPLRIKRRTQTSSTRAVRWKPRSPSPGVLLLMDDIANFQDEWTRLFSDDAFQQAWEVYLDAHADKREEYVAHEDRLTTQRVQPASRESLPLRAVSLRPRPTLGIEPDDEKILRRKSPGVDIFSMLSRDARSAVRSSRLSSPPRIPLPEVPNEPTRVRWSNDSVVSSTSTIKSFIDAGSGNSRHSTPPRLGDTVPSTERISRHLSIPSHLRSTQEIISSNDSYSSLYSVGSTFTEFSSSPPTDKSVRRQALLPTEFTQSPPMDIDEASPLGLVGVPSPYDYRYNSSVTQNSNVDTSYSTNQAFTLTDSPLALSTSSSPVESSRTPPTSHSTLAHPIGGSLRGASGLRSRKVTASLANPRTPFENPRRPPLRSTSFQPEKKPVRSNLQRGSHELPTKGRVNGTESISSRRGRRYTDSTESLKSRISGPIVSVVDEYDEMLDLRDLSIEEEDGSVYGDSSEE